MERKHQTRNDGQVRDALDQRFFLPRSLRAA